MPSSTRLKAGSSLTQLPLLQLLLATLNDSPSEQTDAGALAIIFLPVRIRSNACGACYRMLLLLCNQKTKAKGESQDNAKAVDD